MLALGEAADGDGHTVDSPISLYGCGMVLTLTTYSIRCGSSKGTLRLWNVVLSLHIKNAKRTSTREGGSSVMATSW